MNGDDDIPDVIEVDRETWERYVEELKSLTERTKRPW